MFAALAVWGRVVGGSRCVAALFCCAARWVCGGWGEGAVEVGCGSFFVFALLVRVLVACLVRVRLGWLGVVLRAAWRGGVCGVAGGGGGACRGGGGEGPLSIALGMWVETVYPNTPVTVYRVRYTLWEHFFRTPTQEQNTHPHTPTLLVLWVCGFVVVRCLVLLPVCVAAAGVLSSIVYVCWYTYFYT